MAAGDTARPGATGDTTAPPARGVAADRADSPVWTDDELAARLADPALVGVLPPPPDVEPPEVWGRLALPGDAAEVDDDARACEVLDQLTVHEKLHLLSGDQTLARGLLAVARGDAAEPRVAGALPRLGVPGVRLTGGPQGAGLAGATAFPAPVARGATFDPGLERRVGEAIGAECRALGANLFAGVCADVLHHPASGVAPHTFGEDPHHAGEMAAALVRGVQRHVMACVTGFACGAVPGRTTRALDRLDLAVDDDDLRAVYLPPFRRCVDAGVAAVMTAGHRLNGERAGNHRRLVDEVLKREWGFDGFVVSGGVFGVRSARAVASGMDLEMPFHWRFRSLDRLVRKGTLSEERIDDAALRLVRQQVRFARRAATGGGSVPAVDTVAGPAHRALAREVAERSIVLLRNAAVPSVPAPDTGAAADDPYATTTATSDTITRAAAPPSRTSSQPNGAGPRPAGAAAHRPGVRPPGTRPRGPLLPLDPERVRTLAVLGSLAASPANDPGSDVTVHDGLRAAGERWVINVAHHPGDDLVAAGFAAAAADVAVVVAGDPPHDTDGHGGPAGSARGRRARDTRGARRTRAAISAVLGRRRPRRPLSLSPHDEALIRTVGAANPRTVVVLLGGGAFVTESWREQVGAILMGWLPGTEGGHAIARVMFGEADPGGRLPSTWARSAEQLPAFDPRARRVRYGPLHGYRLMQATGRSPAFPFGFGLSYTTFEHGRSVARRRADGTLQLTVPVVNTGTRVGDEVVQVYVDDALGSEPWPLRTLLAFRRVTVSPGALVNVTFELPPEQAARAAGPAGGVARLHVGRDADPSGHHTVEA